MAIRGISFVALVAAIIGTVFFFYPGGNVVPTPLNPGTANVRGIPIIGLGTWLSEKSKVTDAVTAALDAGYRHIDAAAVYGNEKQVGKALKKANLTRTDLWVTSKLWNTAHRPSDVKPAIKKTLKDLHLDYLDLYLMHWPVALDPTKSGTHLDKTVSINETWAAMEDLVRSNLTRGIGISNFALHDVKSLLANCSIRPAAHEFETHPYLQQSSFVEYHSQEGIPVIAYSPLANTNPTYHSKIPSILTDPYFVQLAKLKGATPAQVILAWGMKRGTIVIPKSVHEKRIVEDLGSLDVDLTDADMKNIALLDKKLRLNDPSEGWGVKLFSDLDGAEAKTEL